MKGIAMTEHHSPHEAHLRLLESWLPLAQHENTVHQWGHEPAESDYPTENLFALYEAIIAVVRNSETRINTCLVLMFLH